MNNKKTKNLTLLALFIAIEAVMVMVPFLGFIPIGPLRATLLHVPVIIATEYVTLVKMGDVLGFLFEGTKLSEEDIALYEQWNAYKKEKNFDEADRVRKELTERGIL